jgi:hypothetical protein
LIELILQEKTLLKLHTKQFGVINFFVLDREGRPSDHLSREVNKRVHNIKEGFSTPGEFNGQAAVRIVVGNYHTTS